jgi:DNA-directed RNA polymerase specialized sigma24 family protein
VSDVRGPDDSELYRELFRDLVAGLIGRGWSRWDAEDATQTALMELFARREGVRDPRAYARTIASRVVTLMRQRRAELPVWWVEPAGTDPDPPGDVDLLVRDCLAILWKRPNQQKVLARTIDGYRTAEIADELRVKPVTVRAHKQRARNAVRAMLAEDAPEVRRLEVLHAMYEAFQSGQDLPVAPRPVIGDAWRNAKALGLDPNRGPAADLLDPAELAHRRDGSSLATDAWLLSTLDDLAAETGTMWVIADDDGVVLWRGGDRGIMARADEARFVDGATWSFANAGPGGIALALTTGRTATVCRFEHWAITQHPLTCLATPVTDPRDGRRWVLNLTGTRPTVHRAIRRELETIALRLRLRLTASHPAPRP